jgi:DNA-binding transcriptional LysR family regulator
MQLDWDNLRVFMELHRAGTLVGAARTLGMDATTVGRRIERLEATLGGKLFAHTPEGFDLTDLGRHILASTEQVERHAIAVQRQASGEDARLEGNVRVTCTVGFAAHLILPALPEFRERHPRIEVELLTGYQLADIVRREADLAVRVTAEGAQVPLAGGGSDEIVVKRLGRFGFGLYASHEYIERHGGLRKGRPLAGHDIIGPTSMSTRGQDWFSQHADGARSMVRCDDTTAIVAATRAGLGVSLLATFIAGAMPELRRLDDADDVLFNRAAWLLVHRDLQHVARILAMSAFLTTAFARFHPTASGEATAASAV